MRAVKRLCKFDKCAPIAVRAASGKRLASAATTAPVSAIAGAELRAVSSMRLR